MKRNSKDKQVTHFESALFRTTSTLCVTADCVILVDPNWLPKEIQNIKSELKTIQGAKPLVMIFTHSDFDHIIGYGAFNPDYIIAHHKLFSNPRKDLILEEVHDFDAKMYIHRDYKVTYPTTGISIDHDGQKISFGKTDLYFYLATGHTDDGIFCIVESLNLMIAGDYLSNIEFPFIYDSVTDYQSTLEKVSGILKLHSIDLLIPGHGDIAKSKAEIEIRKSRDLEYLQNFTHKEFDFDAFVQTYPFPKGLIDEHRGNLKKWG